MIILEGHQGTVTALAYAPDGRTLATGGTDGSLRLWDVVEGRQRSRFASGAAVARPSLAVSADGKLVAAGLSRGGVCVWSLARGVWLGASGFASDATNRHRPLIAFHPSQERLAVAHGCDPVVEVTPQGRTLVRRGTFPPPVSQPIQLNPQWAQMNPPAPWRSLCYAGDAVVAGRLDHAVVWRSSAQGQSSLLHWPNGDCVALASDAAGRWLAGGRARGVALWDLSQPEDPRRTRTFRLADQVNAVALTPDGRTLLAAGDDWAVHVWDVASGQKRNEYNWRLGPVVALAVAPDGMTCAVSGRASPHVLIWDLE